MLPWVSRVRLESSERMCDLLRRDLARERELSEGNAQRYDDLLEKYHELRASGASPAPKGLPREEEPHSPSDIAIEEVVERFGGNVRLRRKLLQYRADATRNGTDDEDIATAIRHWRDPSEDEE